VCGRFTLTTSAEIVARLFEAEPGPPLRARYNIAPTQEVAAVRNEDSRRRIVLLRWGLVPSWAKDLGIGNRLINARAETVAEKPSFRTALRKRRCLVAADGFYEWKRTGTAKQPLLIRRADLVPFAMAGLWERWKQADGPAIESCTIITTDANAWMRPIHDRMPVILDKAAWATWLDPAIEEPERLQGLLVPCPEDALRAEPVGTYLNNPRNDDPKCWLPP
jgi:putative SOS response-associated peptidase YedK